MFDRSHWSRAVLTCVSKSDWFATPWHMIDLKKLPPLFIQSGVKPKPIVTGLHSFSRALRPLHGFTLSFDWFLWSSVSLWLARVMTLVMVLGHPIEICLKTLFLFCWSFQTVSRWSALTLCSVQRMRNLGTVRWFSLEGFQGTKTWQFCPCSFSKLPSYEVKSAYELSASLGGSISRLLLHEATRSISTPP